MKHIDTISRCNKHDKAKSSKCCFCSDGWSNNWSFKQYADCWCWQHGVVRTSTFADYEFLTLLVMLIASADYSINFHRPKSTADRHQKSFASSSCLICTSFDNWSKVKLGPNQNHHGPWMDRRIRYIIQIWIVSQPESSPEEIKINLWPRKDILNVRFNQEDLLRLTELSRI